MDDQSFQNAVEMGVLYSCVMPGSGNIISGKSAVNRNYASNSSEALIARVGLKAVYGEGQLYFSSQKKGNGYEIKKKGKQI